MTKRDPDFSVKDKVTVKGAGKDPTIYEIVTLAANGLSCTIRQFSETIKYAEQPFDTSLLNKV